MTPTDLAELATGVGAIKCPCCTGCAVWKFGEHKSRADWLLTGDGMCWLLEWLRANHQRPIVGGTTIASRPHWYATTREMRPFVDRETMPESFGDTPPLAVASAVLAVLRARKEQP